MIDFSTPLSGMTRAETSVNQIATRLAQPAIDNVDLSTDVVRARWASPDKAVDTGSSRRPRIG